MTADLSIRGLGAKFENPIMLGSGTLVEKYEHVQPYIDANIGGIVPRSTRLILERRTHPVPHLYETGRKRRPVMLNAEWTGADISYWRPFLQDMADSGKVAMSISGRDIAGCVEVCKELDNYAGWQFHEINVSCAHSNDQHGMITRDQEHIYRLISELKDAGIEQPIAIKLGYSQQFLELCQTAKDAGADAIVAINTFGPVFDFYIDNAGKPQAVVGISGAKGGLSGTPLFQIALTAIAEIKSQIDIEVIGCGGVNNGEDIIKMIMAGASLVQVYSAAHVRGTKAPEYFQRLLIDLDRTMHRYSIDSLDSVKGKALTLLNQGTEMAVKVPRVDEKTCIGCDACIPICLPNAIYKKPTEDNRTIVGIDQQLCVGCGHCLHVCPTQPNALEL